MSKTAELQKYQTWLHEKIDVSIQSLEDNKKAIEDGKIAPGAISIIELCEMHNSVCNLINSACTVYNTLNPPVKYNKTDMAKFGPG